MTIPKIGRWYKDEFNEYLMPLSYKVVKAKASFASWSTVSNKIIIISANIEDESAASNYIISGEDMWFDDANKKPTLMSRSFSIKLPSKTKRKAIVTLFKNYDH
jgi:hypothetical protein